MAYARRLNLASQQGEPGARVNDQPLSWSQLASLSGAPESNLRQDPQLFPLPEELAPAHLASQTTSMTDTRSQEEIERTRRLHRPGPRRGLDDLPAMWEELGKTAGTEEQRERARTFVPRLQFLGAALGNWGAVRAAAYQIETDASEDYSADLITGVDYQSIAEQLAIVFRRVPDDPDTARPDGGVA
jgi:hypothetical protein